MKKILFIVYSHTLGGGAEKVLSNVLNGLANKTDYEISVLQYADYGLKKENIDSRVKQLKAVVDMNNSSRIERILKFFLAHICPSLLRLFYAKDKYDVEIAFNYQIPSFLTRKNTYNIQWNHGDVYDLKASPFKRFLQGRCYKKAHRIVAISQNTKNSIVDLFPKYSHKIRMIYNGTDVSLIRNQASAKADINLKENSMVFLGRLEDNKNPLELVKYTHRLINEGINVNLYLLGRGELEKNLKSYIEEAGIAENIKLPGYIDSPYSVIKQSSAVCMLSKSEGFPTVFTEGMALGVPFISTPVGGVAELSNNGKCGKVVTNYDEFKQAVLDVVINKENDMSRNCLEFIKNFSCDKHIDEIVKLIEEA